MPFEVPPLPYDYAALEPHIDEQTMHLHHDKHHQAYVDNANKALDGTEWADRPVESVLAQLDIIPDDKHKLTVIGVVADTRINGLKDAAAMVYLPYWVYTPWTLTFLVRSSQSANAMIPALGPHSHR